MSDGIRADNIRIATLEIEGRPALQLECEVSGAESSVAVRDYLANRLGNRLARPEFHSADADRVGDGRWKARARYLMREGGRIPPDLVTDPKIDLKASQ